MKRFTALAATALALGACAFAACANSDLPDTPAGFENYTAVDVSTDIKREKFAAELKRNIDLTKLFGDLSAEDWSFNLAASATAALEASGNVKGQNGSANGNSNGSESNQNDPENSANGSKDSGGSSNGSNGTNSGQNGSENGQNGFDLSGKFSLTEQLKASFARLKTGQESAFPLSVNAAGEARLKGDAQVPEAFYELLGLGEIKETVSPLLDDFDYTLKHNLDDEYLYAHFSESAISRLPDGMLPENGKIKLTLPKLCGKPAKEADKFEEAINSYAEVLNSYIDMFVGLADSCKIGVKVSEDAGYAVKLEADEDAAWALLKEFAGNEIYSAVSDAVTVRSLVVTADFAVDGSGKFQQFDFNAKIDGAADFDGGAGDFPPLSGDVKIELGLKVAASDEVVSPLADREKEEYTPLSPDGGEQESKKLR